MTVLSHFDQLSSKELLKSDPDLGGSLTILSDHELVEAIYIPEDKSYIAIRFFKPLDCGANNEDIEDAMDDIDEHIPLEEKYGYSTTEGRRFVIELVRKLKIFQVAVFNCCEKLDDREIADDQSSKNPFIVKFFNGYHWPLSTSRPLLDPEFSTEIPINVPALKIHRDLGE